MLSNIKKVRQYSIDFEYHNIMIYHDIVIINFVHTSKLYQLFHGQNIRRIGLVGQFKNKSNTIKPLIQYYKIQHPKILIYTIQNRFKSVPDQSIKDTLVH